MYKTGTFYFSQRMSNQLLLSQCNSCIFPLYVWTGVFLSRYTTVPEMTPDRTITKPLPCLQNEPSPASSMNLPLPPV